LHVSFCTRLQLGESTYISQCETQCRVHVSRSIDTEATSRRKPSRHLTKSSHDSEHDKAHERVRDQYGSWPSSHEGSSGTDNQACAKSMSSGLIRTESIVRTGSNGTSDSNHSDLPTLQPTLKRLVLSIFRGNQVAFLCDRRRVSLDTIIVLVVLLTRLDVRGRLALPDAHHRLAAI